MPIVGTAGHVDHGKSTLVQALTGRDPDRWREEKERGLTIDLGFAWTNLGAGVEVGFVDVPGHERFIKNMLAGVGGMDVAILVVAADEGWMPQTEEHAAILDLLGITHGVVALTRIDLADPDVVELAHLEVDELVAGTTIEGWPIIPVSAVTGDGLDSLRGALLDQLDAAGPSLDERRPRLWIDRSFVIAGAGVVVTGTLTGGELSIDDHLLVYPDGVEARVRGLQSHEASVEVAAAGSRVAINLAGVDRDEVPRGTLLAGRHSLITTRRLLGSVRRVRGLEDELTDRGAYHLHVGTAAVPVRLRFLEHGVALVTCATDVALRAGDRYILRDTGRRAVVAGGTVLDPDPGRRPTRDSAKLIQGAISSGRDAVAEALLVVHGRHNVERLRASSGGGTASGLSDGIEIVSNDEARSMEHEAVGIVSDYHERHPLRPGVPKSTLASAMSIPGTLLDVLVDDSVDLVEDGTAVRMNDFSVAADIHDWSEVRAELSASLAVPRASDLGIEEDLIHALIREDRLVRVADDLVYLSEQIDQIRDRLDAIESPFTVSTFRDELGLSRRQAVPLLEWTDRQGWTKRDGDFRTVRRQPSD